MTDSRATAVVKEALSDGDAPKPEATAVVKQVYVDGDAPKPSATAVLKVALVDGDDPRPMVSACVKMVWANIENADDCCCTLTFPSMMMVRP